MLLLVLACASHRVSWEVLPAPGVEVDTTAIAVAAEGRDCRDIADDLVDTLNARPGVHIEPGAATRLVVRDCEALTTPVVEIQEQNGLDVDHVRRRVVVTGAASARVEVHSGHLVLNTFEVAAEASEASPWTDEHIPAPRVHVVDSRLAEAVAVEVADLLVPLPSTLQRRIYKDPDPGTAKALHNEAVAAEQEGDLTTALYYAREAYAANPTGMAVRYIQALESHAQMVGYSFQTLPSD